MSTKVLLKKSSVLGKIPLTTDLSYGELALNYADGKLYFKDSANNIKSFDSAPQLSLNDLTDVDTVSTPPVAGNVLKWNGSVWAPAIDSTAGGSGTDADTLDGYDSSYFLNYNNLTNKPTLFSGNYNDLSNKPTIPTLTSQLTNDSGFITSAALSGYATESYVNTQLSSKQDTLVSGTNIKTINGQSLLGSGNISISGGGASLTYGDFSDNTVQAPSLSPIVLDSYSLTTYRSGKYIVQAVGTTIHTLEVMITHDDTSVYMNEYSEIITGSALFTIDAAINGSNIDITVTPTESGVTFDFVRTLFAARSLTGSSLQGDLMSQSGSEDLQTSSGSEDLNV